VLATFGSPAKATDTFSGREFERDRLRLPDLKRSVQITSETLRPALTAMLRRFDGSRELENEIENLSKDENAQGFLAQLLAYDPHAFKTPEELAAATEFYRAQPSWWTQNVESLCEKFSEGVRERIPEGMVRDQYDTDIGVVKGLYRFSKDIILLIPSLLEMGYRLFTDDKTQNETWEAMKKLSSFYFYLRFGTYAQKRKALEEANAFITKIVLALWEQVKMDWEKAREAGKENEYVAEMATRGVLEILTAGIGVAKGPKAVKAIREMAHAADYASKTAKAPLLIKLKVMAEPLRLRKRLALGAKLFPGRGKRFLREFAMVKGKVVEKYDSFTKGVLDATGELQVGPLKELDAASFSGARFVGIVLEEPLLVHRAWAKGAKAKEFGAYWSVTKPRGSFAARMESALLPIWGELDGKPWLRSQATRCTTMQLPVGTKIYFGEVANMGGAWNGGFSQLRVDGKINPTWKVGVEEILK